MTALAANRDTAELTGRMKPSAFTVASAAVLYAGALLAVDATGALQPAADTLGLRVVGRAKRKVDNSAGGLTGEAEHGLFRYANASGAAAVTRALLGQVCYVVDDQTVAATSTNLVAAGLVYDVDTLGVWVDQTPAALAAALRLAAPKRLAKNDDYTITAAEAFAGNVVFTMDAGSQKTLTLPSAVAGYRVGVARISATAAHDVAIKAASGDTVLGSAAAKQVENQVDAVSQVLWLRAADLTNWCEDTPPAGDLASWVVNNG